MTESTKNESLSRPILRVVRPESLTNPKRADEIVDGQPEELEAAVRERLEQAIQSGHWLVAIYDVRPDENGVNRIFLTWYNVRWAPGDFPEAWQMFHSKAREMLQRHYEQEKRADDQPERPRNPV